MLEINWNKVGVVILAAGKGTRLNCVDKPKVMCEIGGQPIVSFIIDTLYQAGFTNRNIVMVVGFQKEKVMEFFGDRVSYAVQEEMLGTAHAAYVGMKKLPPEIETVLVIQGDDSAFYKKETLLQAIKKHLQENTVLTLLSATVKNPGGLGRIVRHANGKIEIIEKEYATEEQKKINEISTGTFIYDRAWFEKMFLTMPKLRKLGEYGQPTALAMARDQGQKFQVVPIVDSEEWFGINTPEELNEANQRKLK